MSTADQAGSVFSPPFPCGSIAHDLCIRAFQELAKWHPEDEDAQKQLKRLRSELVTQADKGGKHKQDLRFILSVLIDLRSQGWHLQFGGPDPYIVRPESLNKAHIRASHAVARDNQLRQPSVRAFIRKMEKRRWLSTTPTSIFSLMRDGRELAAKLRHCLRGHHEERLVKALREVIDPYIEVVRPGETCKLTGYELSDIWRYFRHTWITSYKSAVGRELKILIRDRATSHHAVIGIGALVSPRHLVHVDRWVGWEKREFLKQLQENPSTDWAKWIDSSLNSLLGEIFVSDFIKDKILTSVDLQKPKHEVIDRLLREAESARSTHRLYPEQAEHKGEGFPFQRRL
jgi:hypothetical protein